MTYRINKTDGTELVSLNDGELDTSTTDLSLIGRSYKNFGESINENFIKLLENFANTNPPSKPLNGQIWYDTLESRLKVYDSVNDIWRTGGGPIISADQPLLVAGDIWFNNATNQMYFYDGTDTVLIGPLYTAGQGESGFKIETVLDTSGRAKIVAKLYISNQLLGVFSREEFTPRDQSLFPGISGAIKIGFTPVEVEGFKFHGTALDSQRLNGVDGNSFLRSDQNDITTGSLKVQNNAGLVIGGADNLSVNINLNSNETRFVNNVPGADLSFFTRSLTEVLNPIKIDTANGRLGVFNSAPSATLDVSGDAIIRGNLTVTGDSVTTEVSTIQVEDKNIELSVTDLPSDAIADGGGITLKGTTDHTITWVVDGINGNYWGFSEHINLITGKAYKIGNTTILDQNRLHDSVTRASGLTQIGQLQNLDVDEINLNGSTITTTSPLSISSNGNISINNQRIEGLQNPVNGQDAATKSYVDAVFQGTGISLSMDITDYPFDTSLNNGPIQDYLTDIYPPDDLIVNTLLRMHAITYSNPPKRELRIYRVENINGTNEWRHASTSIYP